MVNYELYNTQVTRSDTNQTRNKEKIPNLQGLFQIQFGFYLLDLGDNFKDYQEEAPQYILRNLTGEILIKLLKVEFFWGTPSFKKGGMTKKSITCIKNSYGREISIKKIIEQFSCREQFTRDCRDCNEGNGGLNEVWGRVEKIKPSPSWLEERRKLKLIK